jgi:O-antigen/teichoic acid export membrane protein
LGGQRALAKAAGWSLVAAVVARGANVVALVICARLLTQKEFGHLAIVQSTVGMFAPVASLGLGMTCAKFAAECRDTDPARAGRILGLSFAAAAVMGVLVSIALILLSPWIASRGLASPEIAKHLIAASGLLALGVFDSAQTGALTGLAAFAGLARIGAWSGVISIPVVAFLASANGAQGAIAGLTASLAISCLFNWLALRREFERYGIRTSLQGLCAESRVLLNFSLPSYISGLLVAPVTWLASALLVQQPSGFSEMALFGAADRFRYLLIFLPLAVSRIAVPALSRLHSNGDKDGYQRAFTWNVTVASLATAIPTLLVMAVSPALMSLFGPQFRPGWPVLAAAAFSAIPTVLNTQLGAALLSEGRAWERASADLLLAAAFLSLTWWAVPRWNAVGLAASFAAAYSIACALLAFFVWRGRVAGR